MSAIDMPFFGTDSLILFLAKATLVLVAALIATASLRRSTAGARHLVWLTALVGVLALPLLSRIPSLKIALLPSRFAEPTTILAPVLAPVAAPVTAAAVAIAMPAATLAARAPIAVAISAPPAMAAVGNGVTGGVPAGIDGGVSAVFPGLPASGYSALSVIAMTWALVALVLVGWLIAGAISVRRIVTSARELTSPDWTTPLCEVADRLDLDIPPRLVLSDRIEMAFACRATAPTIVLPASAEAWTDDRRRAVLFHELAHVKRHDLVGHTLGRLACALYWFHPLVWTAAKRLRAESERACDDLVLSCGARPSEYAQHLLDMVTTVRHHGAPVMALPMARKKEFEGRMLAILDPAIRRASPGRLQAAAVIGTLGVLSLTIAAVSPATATPVAAEQTAAAPRIAAVSEVASSEAPVSPPSVARVSPPATPAASPAPAPSSAPVPSPQPSPRVSRDLSIHVKTGNAQLDELVNGVASVVVSGVGTAFQQAGAELSRSGRLQATDTGRVAMMIKILGTDTDASVRRTAAWGLHDLETRDVRAALMKALQSDADERVREMAAWALGEQANDAAAPALSAALAHDKSARVRYTAAWALGETEAKSETSALESALSDSSAQIREVSAWALGRIEDKNSSSALTRGLADPSKEVRLAVTWALGQIEDRSAAPAILAAFKRETDTDIRSAELRTLAVLDAITPELVEDALKSTDPAMRRRAVTLLAGGGSAEPWPWPRPQPRTSP